MIPEVDMALPHWPTLTESKGGTYDPENKCTWVTLGRGSKGGMPVCIDGDGTIKIGPKGTRGKSASEPFGDESEGDKAKSPEKRANGLPASPERPVRKKPEVSGDVERDEDGVPTSYGGKSAMDYYRRYDSSLSIGDVKKAFEELGVSYEKEFLKADPRMLAGILNGIAVAKGIFGDKVKTPELVVMSLADNCRAMAMVDPHEPDKKMAIAFNRDMVRSFDKVKAAMKVDSDSGWSVGGDDAVEVTTVHEMGHVFDFHPRKNELYEFIRSYGDDRPTVSRYGDTDFGEYVAELFAKLAMTPPDEMTDFEKGAWEAIHHGLNSSDGAEPKAEMRRAAYMDRLKRIESANKFLDSLDLPDYLRGFRASRPFSDDDEYALSGIADKIQTYESLTKWSVKRFGQGLIKKVLPKSAIAAGVSGEFNAAIQKLILSFGQVGDPRDLDNIQGDLEDLVDRLQESDDSGGSYDDELGCSWVTMKGSPVCIKGGKVVAGPQSLKSDNDVVSGVVYDADGVPTSFGGKSAAAFFIEMGRQDDPLAMLESTGVSGESLEALKSSSVDKRVIPDIAAAYVAVKGLLGDGFTVPPLKVDDNRTDAYAYATTVRDFAGGGARRYVAICTHVFGDKDKFEAIVDYEAETGFFAEKVFSAVTDTLLHELGHIFDFDPRANFLQFYLDKTIKETGSLPAVSGYAETNRAEYVAELFAKLMSTPPEKMTEFERGAWETIHIGNKLRKDKSWEQWPKADVIKSGRRSADYKEFNDLLAKSREEWDSLKLPYPFDAMTPLSPFSKAVKSSLPRLSVIIVDALRLKARSPDSGEHKELLDLVARNVRFLLSTKPSADKVKQIVDKLAKQIDYFELL